MANNFQLNADYYLSKAGKPDNSGSGSRDDPRVQLEFVGNRSVAVGTGTYSVTGRVWHNGSIFADGGAVTFQVEAGGGDFSMFPYAFANNLTLNVFGNAGTAPYGDGGTEFGYRRCTFYGFGAGATLQATGEANHSRPTYYDCTLVGLTDVTGPDRRPMVGLRCNYISGSYRVEYAQGSYLGPGASLQVTNPTATSNCNLRGQLIVSGTTYANLAAARAANASWFPSCLNADPKFNNEFAQDYSLQADSPHNVLGIGPDYLRTATSIFLVGPVGDITSTSGHFFLDNATGVTIPIRSAENVVCTQQGGQNRIKVKEAPSGSLVGSYRTGLHYLGDTPQQVERLFYLGGNNSNTDYPTSESLFNANQPEPNNNNVPNARNYASGDAGRNPNRWEVNVWFGSKDNPDPDDPNSFVTGSTPLSVEWNTTPLYNPISLIGNGSPGFNPAATGGDTPRKIQAKYLLYEVTLRNDNYSR